MGVFSLGSVAMGVLSAGLVSMGTVAVGFQTMGLVSIGSMGMGNIRIPIGAEESPSHPHNPSLPMPNQPDHDSH